jgi:O-antigen ligase
MSRFSIGLNQPGASVQPRIIPVLIVFLVSMAFMPMVPTGGLISSAMSTSRLLELGFLSAAAALITVVFVIDRYSWTLSSIVVYPPLLYGVLAFTSGLWSPSAFLSAGKGAEFLLTVYVAILLTLYIRQTNPADSLAEVRALALGMLLAVAVLIVFNLLVSGQFFQYTEINDWSGRKARLNLGYSHPLESAEFLTLILIAMYIMLTTVWLRLAVSALFLYLIYLTDARNLIVFTPLVLGILVFHMASNTTRVMLAFVGMAILSVVLVFLVSGDLEQRLPMGFWTLNNRVPLWQKSFELIAENPVLGIGYYAGRFYVQEEFEFAATAHNSFIEAALTTGLLGLGLILIFCFCVIVVFFKSRNTMLLALLVFVSLSSMFNPVILLPNISSFVFMLSLFSCAERLFDDSDLLNTHASVSNKVFYGHIHG